MKFKLDEKQCDILTLIKQLRDAEQENRNAKGDPALRALLNRAAKALDESQSLMVSVVHDLESVIPLKAGFMDNISRHDEVVNTKNRAMQTAADFLKSFLRQFTPAPQKPKQQSEVI